MNDSHLADVWPSIRTPIRPPFVPILVLWDCRQTAPERTNDGTDDDLNDYSNDFTSVDVWNTRYSSLMV